MNEKAIGERIDAIRKERGWSKTELAKRMGTSDATVIAHIRTGKMHVKWLIEYAETLGCTIADLTDGVIDLTKFTLVGNDIYSYWPYNLVKDVAGTLKIEVYKIYVPAIIKTISTLDTREQQVLIMRYKSGMTLEECGKEMGITRERIRQIEAKAIRKLRHPRRFKSWFFDTLERYEKEAKENRELKLENITLREKIKRLGALQEKLKEEEEKEKKEKNRFNVGIEYLDLSVRSYNCLKKAGINKIADLEHITIGKLIGMRNLGRKSAREVCEKAKEYGINIKGYNEDSLFVRRYL